MKVKSESEVAQSCPTLSDPMDCSLLGSSVHRTLQARVLEWGAIKSLSSAKDQLTKDEFRNVTNILKCILCSEELGVHDMTCPGVTIAERQEHKEAATWS